VPLSFSRHVVVFNESLAVDSALANAWLGRGLTRIRRGDRNGGRQDLLMAAALEPHRALLRSYLGRAWSDAGDDVRALHELELAKSLDAADPMAWLYTALIKQRENRINEAIDDLETSQAVGENRRLYTSQLLLDEQQAARGVNLATAYKRAGLERQSLREATESVSHDYSSYAAHQFLSDSFNAYRDPTRFNLRYETVWFNERLLANLLGRVGDTPLSPTGKSRLIMYKSRGVDCGSFGRVPRHVAPNCRSFLVGSLKSNECTED